MNDAVQIALLVAVVSAAGGLLAVFVRSMIRTTPADTLFNTVLELRRQDRLEIKDLDERVRELEKDKAKLGAENASLTKRAEKLEAENLAFREEIGYFKRRVDELTGGTK